MSAKHSAAPKTKQQKKAAHPSPCTDMFFSRPTQTALPSFLLARMPSQPTGSCVLSFGSSGFSGWGLPHWGSAAFCANITTSIHLSERGGNVWPLSPALCSHPPQGRELCQLFFFPVGPCDDCSNWVALVPSSKTGRSGTRYPCGIFRFL